MAGATQTTAGYAAASLALGAGGVALGMSGLGPVFFASSMAPQILGIGGASLSGLVWLMQTIPPKPKQIVFPGIRLLYNILATDTQSSSIPFWQKALRCSIAMSAFLFAADPRLEQETALQNSVGPVLVVVDNDWQSAKDWNLIRQRIEGVLESAGRQGRSVMVMPTTREQDQEIKPGPLQSAAEARTALPGLGPKPWPADRAGALKALETIQGGASVVWFSNGQDDPRLVPFLEKLEGIGPVSVFKNNPADAAHILSVKPGEELGAIVRRLNPGPQESVLVAATGAKGEIISQIEAVFPEGESSAEAVFDLPPELRRQIVKLSLPDEAHAGAALLLDESWRKRPVGILKGSGQGSLLEDSTYIKPAIAPFTNLRAGSVDEILKDAASAVVMTDEAILDEEERRKLGQWIDKGGMVIRFAGPRLAAQPNDSLSAVPLVPGENYTNGALSGNKAASLSEFANDSPFAGLKVPKDLEIRTRVLSESNIAGAAQVWAEFEDGAPFVTAKKQGDGWVVLVHTAANLEWSNLPLADELFIDMMKAMVGRSKSASAQVELTKPLPPLNILDAQGRLGAAQKGSIKLTREDVKNGTVGPFSPPGFYGQDSVARLAHNLHRAVAEYKPAPELSSSVKAFGYKEDQGPDNFKGILLALGMALILADLLARMKQSNVLPGVRFTSKPEVSI